MRYLFNLFRKKHRPTAPAVHNPLQALISETTSHWAARVAGVLARGVERLSPTQKQVALVAFFTIASAIAGALLYRGLAGQPPAKPDFLHTGNVTPPAVIGRSDSLYRMRRTHPSQTAVNPCDTSKPSK